MVFNEFQTQHQFYPHSLNHGLREVVCHKTTKKYNVQVALEVYIHFIIKREKTDQNQNARTFSLLQTFASSVT